MTTLNRRSRLAITMLVSLVLPLLLQAQGNIDFSRGKTLGNQILAIVLYFAAIGCVIVIVSGLLQIRGHDHASGYLKVVGGLIAAVIVGYGIAWVSALSGQSVQASGF